MSDFTGRKQGKMVTGLPWEHNTSTNTIVDAGGQVVLHTHWVVKEHVEAILEAMNNYGRALTVLKDLVGSLEETEDLEHDFFGCGDEDNCTFCAAKNLIAELSPKEESSQA